VSIILFCNLGRDVQKIEKKRGKKGEGLRKRKRGNKAQPFTSSWAKGHLL